MSKKNILAITIDESIRSFNDQFDTVYRKKFIKNEGLVNMNQNFEYVPEEDEDDMYAKLEAKANALIHLPVTTSSLENHYEFESKDAFNSFLKNHALELYGSAGQIPNGIQEANKLYAIKEELGLEDVILFCPGDNQQIIATLHFLVKIGCKIGHIIFDNNYTNVWKYANMVITDSPEILDITEGSNKTIKLSKEYNASSKCSAEIQNLKDLDLRKLENLIKNNKYE